MKKGLYLVGMIVLFTVSSIFIPSISYAEESLQDIQKERKEIDQNLSKAEKEVAELLIDIKNLNDEIEQHNESLKANEKAINEVESEMDEIKAEITALEEKIEERFNIMKERAQSYQINGGNIGYLEVIFGATDFNDFISRLTAITTITDSDASLINEQEKDKEKVEKKLTELEELKDELNLIESNILEQKEATLHKKEALEEKEAELTKLVTKLEMKDDKLADLEAELLSEMAIAGTSFSKETANSSGVLGWPAQGGYISSHLGPRWGKMHNGIDIARTDRSTKPAIYAAADGTVESAGFNNGGYGNMVIINHGNGMKTLYAHLDSINISTGQSVSRGEQIGIMGTTGSSTGIHLHFEVHVNGSVQNPVHFLQ